jgi:hypothetical protein
LFTSPLAPKTRSKASATETKYRGECRVLVDKFVIVSRRGFTKGVLEKGAMVDVELLTLDEAKEKDWSKEGPGTFTFRKPPHICHIYFLPPIQVPNPPDLWNRGRLICPHGHDHGTPMARAKCLVFHNLFPRNPGMLRDFLEQVEHSPGGEGMIKSSWPHEGFRLRYSGQEYEISCMAVHVHAVSQTGKAKHTILHRQSSRGDSLHLHHIEMAGGGMELSLLIPDGPVPPPQIGVRLRRPGNPADSEGSRKGKKRGRKRKKE